ncbi:MAG: hypothetical protein IKK28_02975 [Mogibacterium sp.]|nr:hypothetical protein [Mogibacterium sp.]
MGDGAMIIIIFACIIIIPLAVVFIVLGINKSRRRNKYLKYKGVTEGRVLKIVDKGFDYPWVIHVRYNVRDVEYTVKETAKLKSETIKVGKIAVGQRKTFVIGPLDVGDAVTVKYDEKNPARAIIAGNEGVVTS